MVVSADERRSAYRYAIQLNKVAGAEITRDDGHVVPCYVFVADVSEGGLRITTDNWFETDEAFELRLHLNPPLAGRVSVIWRKELTGGTNVYGIRFAQGGAELAQQIDDFIETFSPEARRRSLGQNLNRVLSMQFPGVTPETLYVLTNTLDAGGMRVTSDVAFEEGRRYTCRLMLDGDASPLEVNARVEAVRTAVFDRWRVTFTFEDVDASVISRINHWLGRLASGEEPAPQRELDFGADA